jgi:flagella basal body P-ring formation protein FlgA
MNLVAKLKLMVAASLLSAGAGAAALPPVTAQAEQAARRYLADFARRQQLADPEIAVQVLPPARPLPPCAVPLEIEPADTRFLTRLRFTARCPGSAVASDLIVRADITAKVLVTIGDIPAGKPIPPDSLALEPRSLSAAPDAIARLDEVAGLSSRRALRAGQILQKRFLQPLQLVQRGQSVRIVAHNRGIEVDVPGEALQSGSQDELIRVRNIGSGRIISARVIGPGSVEPADAPAVHQ